MTLEPHALAAILLCVGALVLFSRSTIPLEYSCVAMSISAELGLLQSGSAVAVVVVVNPLRGPLVALPVKTAISKRVPGAWRTGHRPVPQRWGTLP